MYQVGGVRNIEKRIILLENNDNICKLALREYKLKKHGFIDNKLTRNFVAMY